VLGNNLPLRGWKGEVYEGGIRVPALVNWPGVLEPRKVAAPVHVVDWMPTLCRLARCPPAKDLEWDGRDVWPLVSGRPATAGARTLYWKTPGASALRRGDLKLVAGKGGKRLELYDLAADPYEKHDLAAERKRQVAELLALLEQTAARDRGRVK
jgi:arylsulfatase A-like enzyme